MRCLDLLGGTASHSQMTMGSSAAQELEESHVPSLLWKGEQMEADRLGISELVLKRTENFNMSN